ncbi:hypothetical protein SASPL_133775 [Salvia splendens]|uniref:Mlo protein n=1 Tax=Salvia splendens TaxID=180675 RepID=A0A8X8X3C3_SALSN|nr:hypothetical protein SASPL_133775 [Salvia splendens]
MITKRTLRDGKVSLISYSGIHQLHIFVFVLAVMHVLYSVILMVLGHAKMKKWKKWELETSSTDYQFNNDPDRFRFARQTSFVRRHSGIYNTPIIKWIVAFFRQFSGSISKVDYMTIRNGFITAHFAPNTKFDFHKYIKRSMEDDYKSVLGIRLIILLVGTKLELVIVEMAQQIQDRTTVVRGAPLVEPSNNFFWFNRPQWILFLIHFTLFKNAYQMAYFLWKWYEFGITTCFHEAIFVILIRVFLGLGLQIVSSYITFPLYTLVTQMGSNMKTSIFEEQTSKALKKWHQAAKQRNKQRKDNASVTMSGNSTPVHGSSPIHLLHNYKIRSNAPDEVSDTELSEIDTSKHTTLPPPQSHNIDFSFGNSSQHN